jgi:hypothetical protein
MTPRFQTLNDNCLQASIASILDVPLEAVPHVFANAGPDFLWTNARWSALTKWAEGRGYELVHVEAGKRKQAAALEKSGDYYIAAGPTSSGIRHCVVMQRGKVIFDPAGGEGITAPWSYLVLKRRGGARNCQIGQLSPRVQAKLERWLGHSLPA